MSAVLDTKLKKIMNLTFGALSPSFPFSAADGATSLNERKARETEDGDQEKRQARFSLLRQAPVKFNSTQEANAMVLAKWAADENMIMSSMEQNSAKANPSDEQSSTSFDKHGL